MLYLYEKLLTVSTGISLNAFPLQKKPLTVLTGISLNAFPLRKTTYGLDRNLIKCFPSTKNIYGLDRNLIKCFPFTIEPLTILTGNSFNSSSI